MQMPELKRLDALVKLAYPEKSIEGCLNHGRNAKAAVQVCAQNVREACDEIAIPIEKDLAG
jgi:hypothetical protein